MRTVLLVVAWLAAVGFAAAALSLGLTGNWVRGLLLALVALLLLPAAWGLVPMRVAWRIGSIAALLVVALGIGFVWPSRSIYRSPAAEARLMQIYDARLARWPTQHSSVFVDTEYGRVHVIVSGPAEAPPLVLLHASGVASWSWLYNAEALNRHYRTYAIDTLGDAGKSVLEDVGRYPRNGVEQARVYEQIFDGLGIARAPVVGASEGGFIATNLALHAPERVRALALLGPMGYAGTTSSIVRIVLTTFFPFPSLRRSTTRWALGDSEAVQGALGEWFPLLLAGVLPAKLRPSTFSGEEMRRLHVPVMLVLGAKDRLVGDPDRAIQLAREIPELRAEVVASGHIMGIERADDVDALLLDFLGRPD